MTTLGIILIIIGIIGLILGIFLYDCKPYIFLCCLAILIPIGVFLTIKSSKPTKQDVIDGKAVYQETQVITGNDTIKTYNIVWKQKN